MNLGQGQEIHFAANYCIKEIDQFLVKHFTKEIVNDFYFKFNDAKLIIKNEILGNEYDVPIHKVVWNLLSRGIPTIASINVSDYLLTKHFPEYFSPFEFNSNEPEIKLAFDFNYFEKELGVIQELLYTPELNAQKVSELGEVAYKLYQLQIDLSKIAKLQLTLLILSFTGKKFNYRLSNFDTELELLAIDDLNSFITVINNLAVSSEPKMIEFETFNGAPFLDLNVVDFNDNQNSDVTLFLNQEHDKNKSNDAFYKMLTDRNIKYGKFGEVENYEENGKQKQRFNIKNKKRKNSLNFLLQNIFRKTDFRPGQEAILNRAIVGKDVIGLLPTGGGKSLTYQINALIQPGVSIVVDPINSLMKDQYDKLFDELKITKTRYINSFNSKEEKEYNLSLLKNGKVQVLFVSPERLQMPEFRAALRECHSSKVFFSCAVIDEAHCVSEWGHDFRHVYLNLAYNLKRFAKPKEKDITLFGLTATASFDVLADVQRELGVKEDAIISLPPDAIDRKELHFRIIDNSDHFIPKGLPFYEREKQVSTFKYPVLKDLILNQIPSEINGIENAESPFISNDDFFRTIDSKYTNAGVIFCPTKSDTLQNGVMSVYNELIDYHQLAPTTYFGSDSDNTIASTVVSEQAKKSVENQEAFINNEKNLMIATKGFGMGIDKPNIRFTIHYSFPNSIESFYQEAGRAGRDRRQSICALLYHPIDEESNRDFFENTNKGIRREKQVIDELLDEVHYEDDFFVKIIQNRIREKYSQVKRLSLYKNRYLYINGAYDKGETFGNIDLIYSDLRDYPDARRNVDEALAVEIINCVKDILREEVEGEDFLGWLTTTSKPGIRTLLENTVQEKYRLEVGFNNNIIDNIVKRLSEDGNENISNQVVLASYNFSTSHEGLLSDLNKNYRRYLTKKKLPVFDIKISTNTIEYIRNNYLKIRDMADTQKAVYRLNIVGVVDDYEINYAHKTLTLIFNKKSTREYYQSFTNYLRRYLGIDSTREKISYAKNRQDIAHQIEDDFAKILYTLIEFVNDEVTKKISRSITYMSELCNEFKTLGESEFRERMVRYFTSKYARSEYLPNDTDGGKNESSEVVKKYISYIKNPPDELGGEIDNAKHLRGACDNLRIGFRQNATLDLLLSFSLFVLELRDEFDIELLLTNPSIKKARELYISGFKRLMTLPAENWNSVFNLLKFFNDQVKNYNENMAIELDNLQNEILLHRTNHKLNHFLTLKAQ